LKQILENIMVNEPNSNFGFISSDEVGKLVSEIADERLSEAVDLSKNLGRRFPFAGEDFENIVLDGDSWIDSISEISRVLQKNRYLILFSKLSKDEIVELFEKHHFSNISEIEFSGIKVFTLKKWFII
jgi:hypothetical protein